MPKNSIPVAIITVLALLLLLYQCGNSKLSEAEKNEVIRQKTAQINILQNKLMVAKYAIHDKLKNLPANGSEERERHKKDLEAIERLLSALNDSISTGKETAIMSINLAEVTKEYEAVENKQNPDKVVIVDGNGSNNDDSDWKQKYEELQRRYDDMEAGYKTRIAGLEANLQTAQTERDRLQNIINTSTDSKTISDLRYLLKSKDIEIATWKNQKDVEVEARAQAEKELGDEKKAKQELVRQIDLMKGEGGIVPYVHLKNNKERFPLKLQSGVPQRIKLKDLKNAKFIYIDSYYPATAAESDDVVLTISFTGKLNNALATQIRPNMGKFQIPTTNFVKGSCELQVQKKNPDNTFTPYTCQQCSVTFNID